MQKDQVRRFVGVCRMGEEMAEQRTCAAIQTPSTAKASNRLANRMEGRTSGRSQRNHMKYCALSGGRLLGKCIWKNFSLAEVRQRLFYENRRRCRRKNATHLACTDLVPRYESDCLRSARKSRIPFSKCEPEVCCQT